MPIATDRTRIVSQEAAYWYIRCSDERAMLRSDRLQFYTWLKRSPENIAEILRISEMDGKFAKRKLIDRVDELEDSNVVNIGTAAGASQYDYEPGDSLNDDAPEAAVTNKPAFSWAVAAAAALIAVSFLLGLVTMTREPDGMVQTAAGQWQHMSLDDGSTVHIDARTQLKIEFLSKRRIVHLYAGQAVFEVAKDPQRPFTVSTELVDVTAVGTRFGVTIDPGVTATVSEGIVKVTPPGKLDAANPVMLKAGEELRVFGAEVTKVSAGDVLKVDAERKLDWANGWLKFDGETIGQAVAEFNRRNAMQIKIDDRVIADRQLHNHRLRVDLPESFARLLDSQEGIVVIRDRSSNVLHLQSE